MASSDKIYTRREMVEWFEGGEKGRENLRIGSEHENFLFWLDDKSSVGYKGGIEEVLRHLSKEGGVEEEIYEGKNIIALRCKGGAMITLEPGGQVELSGSQFVTLHEVCNEITHYMGCLGRVLSKLEMGVLGIGFVPHWRRSDMNWMPKGRYEIMRRYMPSVGSRGLDMMKRTCTVQVNLDFYSEEDMRAKMRIATVLQPIATAIFANSPFYEGRSNGVDSNRALVWQDTDKERCGLPLFVLEGEFSYERWVDYLLSVPMYFVNRGGMYKDVAGGSFLDFLNGRLGGLEGELPSVKDWEDQVSVAFPEVRLKRYVEMRGADSGPIDNICALSSFWVGLLYDEISKGDIMEYIKGWTKESIETLYSEVPYSSLSTLFLGHKLSEYTRDILSIAYAGLKRRGKKNEIGEDESIYLSRVIEINKEGKNQSNILVEKYIDSWKEDIYKIYNEKEER